MKNKNLLRTGIAGSAIAAICCFTPALVILLGVVGFSAWLAWLDFVLLPALALFLGVTIFATLRIAKASSKQANAEETS
jgi:mercuric ion transport protein